VKRHRRIAPVVFVVLVSMVGAFGVAGMASGTKVLSEVKVAIAYENVTDGTALGRGISKTVQVLDTPQADFVLRGFWKWQPIVQSPDKIPATLYELAGEEGLTPAAFRESVKKSGRYYDNLSRWVAGIRAGKPGIIFCGAIPCQILYRVEYNPISRKVYPAEETWKMALDPGKWNLTYQGTAISKEQLQALLCARFLNGSADSTPYDPASANGYFPDITNAKFQKLLLSWAEKQIDCGADALWMDMLDAQTKILLEMTSDATHPAVIETVASVRKIIDKLHEYGVSKGKQVYVGSWGESGSELPQNLLPTGLDFVTFSPSKEEISDKKLDQSKWDEISKAVKQNYGGIPTFAYIDWGLSASPMVTFSQELSTREQRAVLRKFEESFSQQGIAFAYPVHGGKLGKNASKKSFGQYTVYDSMAPEFRTYGVIAALAGQDAAGE
jgi:hypothetical protein